MGEDGMHRSPAAIVTCLNREDARSAGQRSAASRIMPSRMSDSLTVKLTALRRQVQHLLQDDQARDDRPGARSGIQAHHQLAACSSVHDSRSRSHTSSSCSRVTTDPCTAGHVVHLHGVAHRHHRRGRSRHRYQPRVPEAGVAQPREVGGELPRYPLPRPRQLLLRRRVAMQETLGHAPAADVEGVVLRRPCSPGPPPLRSSRRRC